MFLAILFVSSFSWAAIFGSDDRENITSTSASYQQGRATAISVLSSNIEPSRSKPGFLRLAVNPLSRFLCPGERFASDPSLSYACSGFLVAPNLLVTAGHCMVNTGESKNERDSYCSVFGWLFDYQFDGNGKMEFEEIPEERYFRCRQIVFAIREEKPPYRDYALVELDRAAIGREPFRLNATDLKEGQPLSMLGYPMGTPLKRAGVGRVTFAANDRMSFLTNLDAFEGNSGSVVLNDQGEAVGILVGGTPSLNTVFDSEGNCERYNRCDESGEHCAEPDKETSIFPGYMGVGSEVQRIGPVADLMRELEKIKKYSPEPVK